MSGRTIALYGESGSGKTTLSGEYAKALFKSTRKRTIYHGADMGGHDSIMPLVRVGVVVENEFHPESHDIWSWIDSAVSGVGLPDDIGLAVFDSGTSMGEALLSSCAKLSAAGTKVGSQNILRFNVPGLGFIGANTESHYGVVQSYLLDQIWKSTWLSRRGIDVLWTFSVYRGEKADDSPILGPKLAGKALTSAVAKWFKNTFYLSEIPQDSMPARHILYTQSHPEMAGLGMSFGNSRYPLDAISALPSAIEPASLVEAFRLIEAGHTEADSQLASELGL